MAESLGEAVLRLGADLNPLAQDLAEARGMSVREMARTARESKKAAAGIFLGLAVTVGAGLAKVGEEFDGAFDTIRQGTGATGKQLERLKDDFRAVFREVPASADEVATAIADINTRLGLTGRPLRRMAEQLVELSRITETDLATNIREVTRAMGDWKVPAAEQPELLDKMFRASQATGIAVADLARQMTDGGVQLRAMGFSVDETIALLSRFEREGVVSSRIVNSLRMGLARMAQEGVTDTSEAFDQLIDRIKNAGSVGEATRLAIEVFGSRAGPDMALAIREGRLELDELIKQVKSGEDTIVGVAEETDDWREKLQELRNRALLALEGPATKVFDLLGVMADGAAAAADAFMKLPGPIQAVAAAIAVLGGLAMVNPWLALATGLVLVVGMIVRNWRKIKGFLAGVWQWIRRAAVAVWEHVIAKTPLGALVKLVVDNWSSIRDFLGGVWSWIKRAGARVWDTIKDAARSVADVIRGVWDGIISGIRWGIDKIAGLVTTMMNTVADMVEKLSGLPIIGKKFRGLADGIRSSARSIDKWRENLREADTQRKRNERGLESLQKIAKGRLGRIAGITERDMERVRDAMDKGSDKGRDALARNYDRAIDRIRNAMKQGRISTRKGLELIEKLMLEKLRLYGVQDPKGFLQESKAKLARARRNPEDVRSLATGGVLVPGVGDGDKVPLHIGGRLAAMVEPGELVSVTNKRATAALMALNTAIPRRMAQGGIVELLWRTKDHYDHLHVALASYRAAVRLGKRLQKMGYAVGEHPAFGGVSPVHTAGSYHYRGQALDVNADHWPGGEMAALDKLYRMLTGGKVPIGGPVAAGFKLPRFTGTSPLGDVMAVRLNQFAAGMERELASRLGGIEGAEMGAHAGGQLGKAALANLWTRAGGSRAVANLAAAIALAESGGNPRAVNRNANGTWDAGLWQINQIHGYPMQWLFNAANNAKAAVRIWRDAGGFSPWVAYQRGMHRQYMRDGGVILPYLGKAHTGGVKAAREGLVHVKAGEQIGWPHQFGRVQVVLQGDGAALLADMIDEMHAVIDDRKVEIVETVLAEGGRVAGRSRQVPGFAGRAG